MARLTFQRSAAVRRSTRISGPIIALCFFLFAVDVSFASVGSLVEPKSSTPLAEVAEWVALTGIPTVVRAPVARALALPDADLAVSERGFRATDEMLTHVCAISGRTGSDQMVVIAVVNEYDGSAFVWRTTVDGRLAAAAFFDGRDARPMTLLKEDQRFEEEKRYFLGKCRSAKLDQNPAPVSLWRPQTKPPVTNVKPSDHLLRSERFVIAKYPWVLATVGAALGYGARPVRRV